MMIPNTLDGVRRWHVLAGICQQFGYQTAVEVGCKEGRTTEFLLQQCPGLTVHAIDPWAPMPEHAGREGGETYEDWDFEAIAAEFWRRVGPYKDRVIHHRATSLDVASRMEPALADLVFIDAAHDYDNVRQDIRAWWPVVRAGGVLAGHDYQHKFPGVMRAVADEFNLLDVSVTADSVWFVRKG
jgi:hypothetical protein